MDPVTHILLGATTAQLTARRRVGRDTTWVAAVTADLADVDVVFPTLVSFAGGDPNDLPRWMAHRGLTHSVLMVPVIALLAAGLWWLARRAILRRRDDGPGFGWLYLATFAAALTHPLLDWCTSYGTQLLSPFTSRRFALDAIGIIDLVFTGVLAVGLLICLFVRHRGRGHAPAVIAGACIALCLGYLAAGGVLRHRAVALATDRVGTEKVLSAEAYPSIGTILVSRTVVETESAWHVARVHFLAEADRRVRAAPPVPRPKECRWHEIAAALPQVVDFAWVSTRPLRWDIVTRNGGQVVTFYDMRYAWPPDSTTGIWTMDVAMDAAGNVMSVGRTNPVHRGDRRKMFREVWRELWNP